MMIDIVLMPNDIKYLDLDDNTSFTVISDEKLSEKKYFSIILSKYGKYSEKIKAKDYTKIKISKKSWYFLFFFIILFIVGVLNKLGS